jgi:NADH pyrophosphatase NudC (nudix superfamily)
MQHLISSRAIRLAKLVSTDSLKGQRRRASLTQVYSGGELSVRAVQSSGSRSERSKQPLHFDRFPLDRAGDKRYDQSIIEGLAVAEGAVVVVFVDGKPLVGPKGKADVRTFGTDQIVDAEGSEVMMFPCAMSMDRFMALSDRSENKELVLLGLEGNGTPVFSAEFSSNEISEDQIKSMGLEAVDARRVGPKLCAEDASILAVANGILSWHRNGKYDPRTGKKVSESVLGGFGRRVPGELRAQYPRVDPAVIVSAEHGNWLLLGRKRSWAAGRYSLLAGFVEIGESLEDAAVREVAEESGVELSRSSLVYKGSQPWPFPRSLMVGFYGSTKAYEDAPHGFDLLDSRDAQMAARHTGVLQEEIEEFRSHLTLPKVQVDQDELEDARWFHLKYLSDQLKGGDDGMRIPGKHAIASSIINDRLDLLSREHVLDTVPSVNLGPGTGKRQMKYVLIRVNFQKGSMYANKLIVRGDPRASYHNNVFTAAKAELQEFSLDILGGGRIAIDDESRSIKVYGYSAAFGAAVHEIPGAILLESYPFYAVEVSYDGY